MPTAETQLTSRLNLVAFLLDLEGARWYAGRGSYGSQCLAIATDNPFQTIATIVEELPSLASDDGELASLNQEFARILQGARTDSLGRGSILYFPSIKEEDFKSPSEETSEEGEEEASN